MSLPLLGAGKALDTAAPPAVVYSDLVIAMVPSLYWTLDGATGATDQSGNGRDGTAEGGVTVGAFASSPITGETTCTDFDGIDDRISSTYAAWVDGSVRSIALWAWRDVLGLNAFVGDTSSDLQFRGEFAVDTIGFIPGQAGTTAGSWSSAGLGTGAWHHVVLTFNEATDAGELFVDGSSEGAQAIDFTYGVSAGATLGRSVNNNVTCFDGKMAHFAIFERALTGGEITTLADATP